MSHSQYGVSWRQCRCQVMACAGSVGEQKSTFHHYNLLQVHEDNLQARQVGLRHNTKSCEVCTHVLQLKLCECGCQLMWWLAGMCSICMTVDSHLPTDLEPLDFAGFLASIACSKSTHQHTGSNEVHSYAQLHVSNQLRQ
jgi:hypothetical protein